jgi:uncharacterized tellurite resistance protein B-like protein
MAGFIDSILGFFNKKNDSSLPSESSTITEKLSIKTRSEEDRDDEEVNNILPIDLITSSQNILDSNQSDDEYRSITVHGHSIYDPLVTQSVTQSSNTTTRMNWSGNGRSISVQGISIKNPLTYWSRSDNLDASCIVKSLKVEIPDGEKLPSLPYWPQYSGLTPTQRGKYLLWLSQGRNDDLDEIGYAFIFFYGLERRIILENQDYDTILPEVQRLQARYPTSGSFNNYLNHFMAYVVGFRLAEMKEKDIRKIFPEFDGLEDYPTKVILSWHWSNKLPITWDLCYSISKNSVGFSRTILTRKAPVLLKQLFRKKILEQFPNGIPLSSDYDQFQLNYKPASPSLLRYVGYSENPGLIKPLTLPIPRFGSLPFETVRTIWADCIEELKPVSNKIVATDGKVTREVYGALPDALKDEIPHPDLELWRNFISAKQPVDGSILIPISDIAHQIGIEKRDVLTTNQSIIVTSTVRDFGWVVVPDQTISGTSYKWNDTVAIIPFSNKENAITENFQSAALIFEIAHGIAASDEGVSEIEENFLKTFISDQFSLNVFEIECLKGVQKVLEIQPPSLSRIGKRLSKHLNPEQKIALANFLGEIVLLDNKFVKEEQKAIKTVFKALEIDPAVSDELIKKFLVGHVPDEPITVLKSGKTRKGEAIPPPVIKPEFSMNKEKLDQIIKDTKIVREMLEAVFEQEQEGIVIDIKSEVKIPETPVKTYTRPGEFDLPFPSETIPSLDTKYLSMLHDIMKLDELSLDDFTVLARKHNLMPRAACDDINTWALEELGDFLLEESESRIVINYKK